MAYKVGYVDNTGSEGIAHWQMLLEIKAIAEANGWVTLRYLNPGPYTDNTVKRELILRGEGLSGDQQIFVGFRAYQNVAADYYNLTSAAFTGYVEGNAFEAQPGYYEAGVPAHNRRIDYWLVANAQRVTFGLKVGTPVFLPGYAGYLFAHARPDQFPYPICVGGLFQGPAAIRFSDPSLSMPYRGTRPGFAMRFVDGSWRNVDCWPWNNGFLMNTNQVRDNNGVYVPLAVSLNDASPNIYGTLDGIYSISGYDNATENTTVIDGDTYVVLQDGTRNGFNDYMLLRLA